jgi:Na+-driven multidrug efflux pump
MLDSVAIAAQALVGRYLGVGNRDESRRVAWRLLGWGTGFGIFLLVALGALRFPIAGVFSSDPEVIELASGLLLWLALVQPLSAVAFTLDGILIGASDTRFLAVWMVVASAGFIAVGLLGLSAGWGAAGLAAGATLWMAIRSASLGLRFRGHAWMLHP